MHRIYEKLKEFDGLGWTVLEGDRATDPYAHVAWMGAGPKDTLGLGRVFVEGEDQEKGIPLFVRPGCVGPTRVVSNAPEYRVYLIPELTAESRDLTACKAVIFLVGTDNLVTISEGASDTGMVLKHPKGKIYKMILVPRGEFLIYKEENGNGEFVTLVAAFSEGGSIQIAWDPPASGISDELVLRIMRVWPA